MPGTPKVPGFTNLNISVSQEEKDAWRRRARLEGYTAVGSWMRMVLSQYVGMPPPKIRRRRHQVPLARQLEEERREGEKLLELLARGGGRLDQAPREPYEPAQHLPGQGQEVGDQHRLGTVVEVEPDGEVAAPHPDGELQAEHQLVDALGDRAENATGPQAGQQEDTHGQEST